jgi:hypothetical protein
MQILCEEHAVRKALRVKLIAVVLTYHETDLVDLKQFAEIFYVRDTF